MLSIPKMVENGGNGQRNENQENQLQVACR